MWSRTLVMVLVGFTWLSKVMLSYCTSGLNEGSWVMILFWSCCKELLFMLVEVILDDRVVLIICSSMLVCMIYLARLVWLVLRWTRSWLNKYALMTCIGSLMCIMFLKCKIACFNEMFLSSMILWCVCIWSHT